MKITYTLLLYKGACREQRRLFALLFPEGVEITPELCVQHANDFDWTWAAENLLTKAAYITFTDQRWAARLAFDQCTDRIGSDYYASLYAPRMTQDQKEAAADKFNAEWDSAELDYARSLARAFGEAALSVENEPATLAVLATDHPSV